VKRITSRSGWREELEFVSTRVAGKKLGRCNLPNCSRGGFLFHAGSHPNDTPYFSN
jgi:hypothetical protein